MKQFIFTFLSFLKTKKIPNKQDFVDLKESPFSTAKTVLISISVIIFYLFLSLLMKFSLLFSETIPDYGGSMREGVIGAPKFVNPLLAESSSDKILTNLIFLGLVEKDNNDWQTALAESFVSSLDKKEYIFILKDDLKFSNGSVLTAEDVVFSFEKKKELMLKQNAQSYWKDIIIEKKEGNNISIKTVANKEDLEKILDLGIVSKKYWESVPKNYETESVLNLKPIGAGPFEQEDIIYLNTIPNEVSLRRNKFYSLKKPYLKKISIKSFSNMLSLKQALLNKDIDSTSVLENTLINPDMLKDLSVKKSLTDKSVALFVSKNKQDIHSELLTKISPFIDKNNIIAIIENGYGTPIDIGNSSEADIFKEISKLGYYKDKAGNLVQNNRPISFIILVRKDDNLIELAKLLSQDLSKFGIITELQIFDQGSFSDHIKQNHYSLVLGTNEDVNDEYRPLIPIYTKQRVHLTRKDLYPTISEYLTSDEEQFNKIESWYTKTDSVWKWFKN